MNRLPASKAREKLADILNEVSVRGDRVVLHRHGKDVAAVVPIEDLRLLEELEDRLDLDAAREALREPGASIPWSALKEKVGL